VIYTFFLFVFLFFLPNLSQAFHLAGTTYTCYYDLTPPVCIYPQVHFFGEYPNCAGYDLTSSDPAIYDYSVSVGKICDPLSIVTSTGCGQDPTDTALYAGQFIVDNGTNPIHRYYYSIGSYVNQSCSCTVADYHNCLCGLSPGVCYAGCSTCNPGGGGGGGGAGGGGVDQCLAISGSLPAYGSMYPFSVSLNNGSKVYSFNDPLNSSYLDDGWLFWAGVPVTYTVDMNYNFVISPEFLLFMYASPYSPSAGDLNIDVSFTPLPVVSGSSFTYTVEVDGNCNGGFVALYSGQALSSPHHVVVPSNCSAYYFSLTVNGSCSSSGGFSTYNYFSYRAFKTASQSCFSVDYSSFMTSVSGLFTKFPFSFFVWVRDLFQSLTSVLNSDTSFKLSLGDYVRIDIPRSFVFNLRDLIYLYLVFCLVRSKISRMIGV